MASTVDVSGAVRFDLPSGTVRLADDEKGILVPVAVLAALVKSAPADAGAQVGRDLGAHLGRGMARRAGSGKALLDGGAEAAVTLLAAELAVAGLGTCNLERWGKALVVHLDASPLADAPDFLAHVIEGALSAASGRSLACTKLVSSPQAGASGGDGGVRVLVSSEGAASRVRGWLGQGVSYGEALVRLQTGGGKG
jgi:hypothetical protein